MKAERNSSFELLRIILIILILVEHGNMWFIGPGYVSESEHMIKCMVQSICIGSVNAFVLISGWFGIKSGLKKIGDLVFMLLFCSIPVACVAIAFGRLSLSAVTTLGGIYDYMLGGNNYWFVADYIGLLIIAPILNNGIATLSRREFGRLLVAGYILIAIYDFVFRSSALGSEGGYSVLWFGYLYLLARYMRLYGLPHLSKYRYPLLILSVAVQSLLFYNGMIGLRYTNPFIIVQSICFILIFKEWSFYSKTINHAAKAALMAYLIHMQPVLVPYISRFLAREYQNIGYLPYMFEVIGLSIMVFIVAIPLNRLQSILYQRLKRCL